MTKKLAAKASDILDYRDLKEERVFVEEWDQEVIVREFSGHELQTVMSLGSFSSDGGDVAIMDVAKVCALSIKDEKGGRMFTDDQAEALADKCFPALMTVFAAAMRVSGFSEEEMEKEKNG
jgi:hypothetical protein